MSSEKGVFYRITQISFFEWTILWLITFVSSVSVFVAITASRTYTPESNHKLPELRATPSLGHLTNHKLPELYEAAPHLKEHSNNHHVQQTTASMLTPKSECNEYSLVAWNKLNLREAIARSASKDKVIILAYVDMGFLEMAENFIVSSLEKHGIKNVLFFSSSRTACSAIESRFCRACYVSSPNAESEQQSEFGSLEFISKMNIRTMMVSDVLEAGYDVLHTDTDVVFLKNPMEDLRVICGTSCDVAPLWDNRSHNAGFLYIKATKNSKHLYRRMMEVAEAYPSVNDQRILNGVIEEMVKSDDDDADDSDGNMEPKQKIANDEEYVDVDKLQNMDLLLNSAAASEPEENDDKDPLKVISLPESYLSGQNYFVLGARHFAGEYKPCNVCMVVHNNWLIEKASKIWRFKENHLWMVDTNQYYSNPYRKFVMLEIDVPDAEEVTNKDIVEEDFEDGDEFELNQEIALENGFKIAKYLNRTFILPRMFINKFSPPMPAWHVKEKLLKRLLIKYPSVEVRESTFLSHPLVPSGMQNAKSLSIVIPFQTMDYAAMKKMSETGKKIFQPRNYAQGPSKTEIHKWFGSGQFGDIPILTFHDLTKDFKFLS